VGQRAAVVKQEEVAELAAHGFVRRPPQLVDAQVLQKLVELPRLLTRQPQRLVQGTQLERCAVRRNPQLLAHLHERGEVGLVLPHRGQEGRMVAPRRAAAKGRGRGPCGSLSVCAKEVALSRFHRQPRKKKVDAILFRGSSE